MSRSLGKTVREMWRTFESSFGPYRPELHYMRGPGPKWHEKYDTMTPPRAVLSAEAMPAPRGISQRSA